VFYVCYVIEIKSFGIGKYMAVIQSDEEGFRQLLKIRLIHQLCACSGLLLVKMSICCFLLRLATRKLYVWFLRGVIVFFTAFTIVCTFTIVCRTSKIMKACPLTACIRSSNAYQYQLSGMSGYVRHLWVQALQGVLLMTHSFRLDCSMVVSKPVSPSSSWH
jgi:hypothetical protein